MRYIWLILAILSISISTNAQETYLDQSKANLYHQIAEAFENKLYARAIELSDNYISQGRQLNQGHIPTAETLVNIMSRIAAVRLERDGAALELENYALSINPDHLTDKAYLVLGDYFYNEKEYNSSIHYYDQVNHDQLTDEQYNEAVFKEAYSNFVTKRFDTAERKLLGIKDVRNIYYFPANYYYGMTKYYKREYDEAIKSFERVSSSSQYKPHIPYYIAQIYFAEGKMTELITYSEKSILEPETKKVKEIRLLLGQAYYQQENYSEALPHLEYYEANTDKLTKDEFYQLAFTQYQLGKYAVAKENFKELTNLDDKQGQLVNYYLADCYVKENDLNSARTAFKKVSQMPYEASMQEEALFNYGKLSAELGNDREAINTLIKVEESSPHYEASKPIINDILVNTDDYSNAIDIIEAIPTLTPELKVTYQMLTLKQAIQLYNEDEKESAKFAFDKSMSINMNRAYSARAQFWTATMLHDQGDYTPSLQAYQKYFELANGIELPTASSPYIAHYNQGYNYLAQDDYGQAEYHFKNAIVGINSDRENINDEYITTRVLTDALVRAGDCAFTANKYEDAQSYYDQAIDRKQPGFDYSLYQRALIEGLSGKPYEKIITLEEIIEENPESEYVDDALYQLGDVYLSLGNTDSATNTFTDLIVGHYGKSPFINAALLKKGLISYNKGDMPAALKFYKRIFVNNPAPKESQAALLAIEEIYIEDLKQADNYFAYLDSIPQYRITDFEKDSLSYVIAENQFRNSNYEGAVDGFTSYLNKFPQGTHQLDAHYMRGESLSILNRYGAANSDYESVIEEGFSNYYESALRKAAIINYNHIQDFKQSYKYFDLLSSASQSPEIIYEAQLGALRSAFRTQNDDAVLTYGSLVYNSEYNTTEEKLSARYYVAKTSYKKGMKDQALLAFQEVGNNATNNQGAESRYMAAKIFYDNNQMELAEVAINNANEKNSAYPSWVARGLLLLSDIYIKNGDLFNARAATEAVVENFSSDNTLLTEANKKLQKIKSLESEQSRIKTNANPGQLELDTTNSTGNE